MSRFIDVEIAFGTAARQRLLRLSVESGTTVRNAAIDAAADDRIAGVDVRRCPLGVWGKPVADDYELQQGDRLEVYRPLQMDPREARRELAKRGLSMGPAARGTRRDRIPS